MPGGCAALGKLSICGLSRSDALDITAYLAGVEYRYACLHLGEIFVDGGKLCEVRKRLMKDEPAAYITGRKEFYGLEFDLLGGVFIPRPESELLAELAIKEKPKRVLDLCTGSGAILLSILSELKDARGVGADFSTEAVNIARRNAYKLGFADRADFVLANILKDPLPWGDFDLITMNPPYLSEREYADCGASVFYEPKAALVAEEEGYHFYNIVLNELKKFNNILLFAEIGASQGKRTAEIARGLGYEVSVFNDLAGRNRVIKVRNTLS